MLTLPKKLIQVTLSPCGVQVMVPHVSHVLPMIPGGGSFKDIITTGDGDDRYGTD